MPLLIFKSSFKYTPNPTFRIYYFGNRLVNLKILNSEECISNSPIYMSHIPEISLIIGSSLMHPELS